METTLQSRPLTWSSADQRLRVGWDDEIDRVATAVARGWSTLVLAPWGAGRSSFLAAVRAHLHDQPRAPAWVWAGGVSNAAELVEEVLAALEGARPRPTRGDPEDVDDALRRLSSLDAGRRLVFVDDLLDAQLAFEVFGRRRDQVWEAELVWVVAGDAAYREDYLAPPADAFFDAVVTLPPLSLRDAEQVLTKRLGRLEVPGGDTSAFVSAVLDSLSDKGGEVADWYPGRVIDRARMALHMGMSADELRTTARQLESVALERVGKSGARLVSALRSFGPASASDEALRDQLGWTRPRVTQVFKQLEEAGLVEGSDQRHGPGRPRRVYRLVGFHEGTMR